MRLWLLCCVLLFGAVQIYDWLDLRAWLSADLSLPWVLLGGVGLAIASHRLPLQGTPKSSSPKSPLTSGSSPAQSPQPSPVADMEHAPNIANPPRSRKNPQTPSPQGSISFEIPRFTKE